MPQSLDKRPIIWGFFEACAVLCCATRTCNSEKMMIRDHSYCCFLYPPLTFHQVLSSVELLGVSCTDESECAMTVDDATFDVTGDTDCGECNEDGEVISVLPSRSVDDRSKGK